MNTYGFELLQETEIPEINSTARLFRHAQSRARLLSVENNDENKVFGITFRTPPDDSTGLPHIMEHAVLCGSRKYPLKEPFVELMKGSLNTFLNAFTYPDKTCYPVASQNLQDFYNLIDVYMDAVLHPLIPPETLQQEGWHYELENLEDTLRFKGVVFNEMKGAYSSPDNLLGRQSQMALFPDHPYGEDSGGNPKRIPDLTYEQFIAFHRKYYHPSNAFIFMYGDDDASDRLRLMDSYLKDFSQQEISSAIPLHPRAEKPHRVVLPYSIGLDNEQPKGYQTVNWMLGGSREPETLLGLSILSYILVGTPASPLYKALIDSGLGEDVTGGGLDSDLRQAIFSTGLKGMAVSADLSLKDSEKLETLILATLQQLATEGIDPESVAAALNTVEFRLRENNTGAFPRGLLLMLRALSTWLYDANPIAPLAFEAPLSAIKGHLASGERYFEDLIREYLVENPHRVTVILQPDPGLRQREDDVERARLDAARASLSQTDLQAIVENTRILKLRQETADPPEKLALIPSLKLEDLHRQCKTIPLEVFERSNAQVLYHDIFTNGIVYLDVGFDLRVLPQEVLQYAPLFSQALIEIGTETQDFVRLSQRIGRSTGGIHPSIYTSAVQGQDQAVARLFLRGKSTTAQAGELLEIISDILLTVKLDNQERFHQMVLESKAGLEASLIPGGHRVVNTRLKSLFNQAAWLDEQMGGVSYLFFLRRLAEQVEKDWPAVLSRLEQVRKLLLNRNGAVCNVTLDAANWQDFQPQLGAFLERLPSAPSNHPTWGSERFGGDEGLVTPAQVNYVGKGANIYKLGYELDGSILVILNYLRATWLWEKVRVQGGAYGGFVTFDHRSGVFTYLSYRDPNLLATLDIYDQTANFLRNTDGSRLSQEELTKSIIGVIGDLDAYQLPDAKGFTSLARYLTGETDEARQRRREQVLSTSQEDFHHFSAVLEQVRQEGRVVVLGSPESLQAANSQRGGDWLRLEKVL